MSEPTFSAAGRLTDLVCGTREMNAAWNASTDSAATAACSLGPKAL